MTLAVDKWNGCGLSSTARRESLPKRDYQTIAMSHGLLVIKMSGRMHSYALKEG